METDRKAMTAEASAGQEAVCEQAAVEAACGSSPGQAAEFAAFDREAFRSRTAMLIGEAAVERLNAATVAVCGIGGVGSGAVEALARAGVGRLRLIDFDLVAASNLNRQLHTTVRSIGCPKAAAMAERIALINPECTVEVRTERITAANVADLLSGVDYIVDAIDDIPAKLGLIVFAKEQGIPVISSMGTGNKLHPERLELADISRTEVCPLARKLRRELRRHGIERGLTVVYSREEPSRADRSSTTPASISFVPPVAGMIIAGQVVRELAELE